MTTRSVKIILVCNTDFFTKSSKFGLYLVCILRKSLYFQKLKIQKKICKGGPLQNFQNLHRIIIIIIVHLYIQILHAIKHAIDLNGFSVKYKMMCFIRLRDEPYSRYNLVCILEKLEKMGLYLVCILEKIGLYLVCNTDQILYRPVLSSLIRDVRVSGNPGFSCFFSYLTVTAL